MVRIKTAFTVLLMVSLLGIAACSDDDGDEGGTTAAPDGETTSTTAAEEQRTDPDQDAPRSPQREGRDDGRGSFRVHHRRLSLLRRGAIRRWAEEPPSRVGDKDVPLPRWHPDDHLHLDTT